MVRLEAPTLWVDVEAFEAAADAGEQATAIGLYVGDLLPEDRFEPWAEERRERLRMRFAQLLLAWTDALEDPGDARPPTSAPGATTRTSVTGWPRS